MPSSDFRLLVPLGVALSTFDGVMLGFSSLLSLAAGLAVMLVACIGEAAIVGLRGGDYAAGDPDGAFSGGAEPGHVKSPEKSHSLPTNTVELQSRSGEFGRLARLRTIGVPWRKVLGSLAAVVLAYLAIGGFLIVDWGVVLSGDTARIQKEAETGSGVWPIAAPLLAYTAYRVAKRSWQ